MLCFRYAADTLIFAIAFTRLIFAAYAVAADFRRWPLLMPLSPLMMRHAVSFFRCLIDAAATPHYADMLMIHTMLFR